ncbi:MAG TPA: NUDIX hydrolase [Candidatus Limnocylindrales bacterium]|nr:NUDIX hydrolase [Candidatus Limnocylindrales bacterium]
MQAWQRMEPTTTTKVGWRTIITKTFRMPDGKMATFDTYDMEGREYVAVIALSESGEVIVARQFRSGPQKIMDELPGGGVEDGESLEQAARRELEEETGYRPRQLDYLGFVHKDEKFNAVHHFFLATGCAQVSKQQLDTDEHIEVGLIGVCQLFYNACSGKMTDSGAVLLAYEQLKQLSKTTKSQNP